MTYKYSSELSEFSYDDILSIYLCKRFVYLPMIGSPPFLNHIQYLYLKPNFIGYQCFMKIYFDVKAAWDIVTPVAYLPRVSVTTLLSIRVTQDIII